MFFPSIGGDVQHRCYWLLALVMEAGSLVLLRLRLFERSPHWSASVCFRFQQNRPDPGLTFSSTVGVFDLSEQFDPFFT